jgi:hypothetical protein
VEEFERLWARYVYSSGVSFNSCDNPALVEAMARAAPGFKIKSTEAIQYVINLRVQECERGDDWYHQAADRRSASERESMKNCKRFERKPKRWSNVSEVITCPTHH